MEKLKSFLISLILLTPLIGFSQDECGTDEMIRRNPFLQQLYDQRVACAPEVDLDTAQVLTIPVVFHVIHVGEPVGEGTNISDEQILSCIENLNHRFRGDVEALAALTDDYDEYELSLVLDSKIEFCLAARDPNNEPTDGIHRVDASNLTYSNTFAGQPVFESYAEDGMSNESWTAGSLTGIPHAYIKELYHWPVDKYFNCYIVTEINGNNGGNGIQGFSLLGSAGTGLNGYSYGPVCLYNVTGTTGTLKSGRELNATWTHEIGHAFNLYHTFSNGFTTSDCDSETNPCTQGDQVPDTPPTSTNQSCSSPTCPDAMVENYMDYTSETCRIAFTQGQIERMREEIWNGLPYLVADDNVSCQSPNAIDVAVSSVTLPTSWCQPTIDFNVKISNFGGNDVSGAELVFDGASYPLPTIIAGGFEFVSFTNYQLGDGVFTFEVIYDQDEYLNNNILIHVVEQLEENVVEVILSPDYWGNEISWEITDENGNILLFENDYPLGAQDSDFYNSSCLPDGCYTFTITDSNGDGMCSFDFGDDGICDAYYDAFVNVIVNGNIILDISSPENIDYGSILELDFCTIYCPPSPCEGDFNGDGLVTVRDLIELLAITGLTIDECSDYDLNNNFVIDVDDVLEFLQLMGYNCGTGEFYDVGMIPLGDIDELSNLSNISHVILDKTIIDVKYYTLRGERMIFNRYVSGGMYLKETLYSDGTKDVTKIFISE